MKTSEMSNSTYSICSNCNQVNRIPLDSVAGKAPICGKCKTVLPIHDGITELQTSNSVKALSKKISVPVIVDFWAPWCQPCLAFAAVFKEAARALAGKAVLTKINTEANPSAGSDLQIRGIPTLVAFDRGAEKARMSGAIPLPEFLQWTQRLRLI